MNTARNCRCIYAGVEYKSRETRKTVMATRSNAALCYASVSTSVLFLCRVFLTNLLPNFLLAQALRDFTGRLSVCQAFSAYPWRRVTPQACCARLRAWGNTIHDRNALCMLLSKSVDTFVFDFTVNASAKRETIPYTLPRDCWPTPPKSAKKGRKSAKALGQQQMAKRPLASQDPIARNGEESQPEHEWRERGRF